MSPEPNNVEIEPAVRDLRNRTLAKLPGDFSRLVYLASSRDYNSGQYHHDGLSFLFGENVASKALAACHREVFDLLVYASFVDLVEELDKYISSPDERPDLFLLRWQNRWSY